MPADLGDETEPGDKYRRRLISPFPLVCERLIEEAAPLIAVGDWDARADDIYVLPTFGCVLWEAKA